MSIFYRPYKKFDIFYLAKLIIKFSIFAIILFPSLQEFFSKVWEKNLMHNKKEAWGVGGKGDTIGDGGEFL